MVLGVPVLKHSRVYSEHICSDTIVLKYWVLNDSSYILGHLKLLIFHLEQMEN